MAVEPQAEILSDVQTALGVDPNNAVTSGNLDKLELYIKLASKSVALYCGEAYDALPDTLSGVVTEMALAKFGKRGNEGKTSAAEEGLTDAWNVDDLAPYMSQLNAYKDNKTQSGAGTEGLVRSFD
ncbi:phage head-tail connector protein [Loigolactobacillus backii]|uniref:phage head-tail connector protein n=1 Tax=Loigolactobacillus backii TaxID=375175 RepID=UPI0007F10A7A|nr:phage head-tail connector protein [Loigolactobacillus backii]ANK59817.1 hypothetical protein AYR52_05810 [Loigolactobacillus backii]